MPERSFGAVLATSAIVAGTVPVKMPWMNRSTINCWTLTTKPISARMTAPPKVARSTISLRP